MPFATVQRNNVFSSKARNIVEVYLKRTSRTNSTIRCHVAADMHARYMCRMHYKRHTFDCIYFTNFEPLKLHKCDVGLCVSCKWRFAIFITLLRGNQAPLLCI
ncbi:uncharacterized protein LOC143146217 isoform X2 [Ptiloglossa arizonensis]|uniref:uncharacterized protein LOC143146217 isoform X2 n=1 Tax=Ptiloglossa arizonensis TaxID=3350558 RepID=UPI003F9F166E